MKAKGFDIMPIKMSVQRLWVITIFSFAILSGLFIIEVATGSLNARQIDPQVVLTKIGQADTGGDAYDVWVDENIETAYVTSGYYGVRIFDISTPSNPVLLSHVPESDPLIDTGHQKSYAHQLLVNNDIIFVGDGPGGLTIINSSDLRNPSVLTRYAGGYTWDIQLTEEIAFIANGWNNLGNPGLMSLNVSTPSNPILINNLQTDFDINDLELVDDRVFLVRNDGGLIIYDISNYSNPVELGEYLGPSGSYAIDVEISNDFAFLTFWKNGLKILNISDPTNITVAGEFNGIVGTEFTFLALENGLAYVANMADGVVVLNVSNPYVPREIGRYKDTGKPYGIFVRNDLIFVADQTEGLKILKFNDSNPQSSGFPSLILVASLSLIASLRSQRQRTRKSKIFD